MIELTKERLEQYIKSPLEHGLTRSEQMEIARQLLARLEQDESAQHPIICRSDERLMETPDVTDEAVKVIGSLNDNGFCHKHPDTPRLKHPYMQLMVYPPRSATYCPKCEPHVAEWEERDKQLRKGKGV